MTSRESCLRGSCKTGCFWTTCSSFLERLPPERSVWQVEDCPDSSPLSGYFKLYYWGWSSWSYKTPLLSVVNLLFWSCKFWDCPHLPLKIQPPCSWKICNFRKGIPPRGWSNKYLLLNCRLLVCKGTFEQLGQTHVTRNARNCGPRCHGIGLKTYLVDKCQG